MIALYTVLSSPAAHFRLDTLRCTARADARSLRQGAAAGRHVWHGVWIVFAGICLAALGPVAAQKIAPYDRQGKHPLCERAATLIGLPAAELANTMAQKLAIL